MWLKWFQRSRPIFDENLKFSGKTEQVYLSNGKVRKNLTVPFSCEKCIALALMGVRKNGRQSCELYFFTSDLQLMKGRKTFPRVGR